MSEWNDGYYQEGYDRCHVVMVMISEILDQHPAVLKCDAQEDIDTALESIMNAYQKISEAESIVLDKEDERRPDNCRNKLCDEGKAYPKSGCTVCKDGGLRGCPYEKGE